MALAGDAGGEGARPASLGRRFEEFAPLVAGSLTCFMLLIFTPAMFSWAGVNEKPIDRIFSGAFDLFCVFTAFLFTFYSFVVSSEKGFLSAVKKTEYFRRLKIYTFKAVVLGAIMVLFSYVMMVFSPEPVLYFTTSYFAVAAWGFGFSFSFISFVRSAYIFSILIQGQGAR